MAQKGEKRPLPHIDDITSVTVNADAYAPVEKILQMAEACLRQAESSRTFGRPDLALKDYIRTNIILLDLIKKNKGWVSLQRDNRAQFERYQRLLRQVNAAHGDFEAIKALIKADNARTGISPTVPRPGSADEGKIRPTEKSTSNGHERGNSINGVSTTNNGVPSSLEHRSPRSKPTIQPKPHNLHGNALGSGTTGAVPIKAQDLIQRFANLRVNAAQAVQDPRIRTQSIIPPRPLGHQRMPSAPPAPRREPAVVADLPRMPDAIYNPPRGTISSETAALPSSAPRVMFSRTNSISSLKGRSSKPPPATESHSPTKTTGHPPTSPKRTNLSVPDGNTISVQDLLRFMRAGAKDLSILLIDIRSRDEFDDGHIMSQATICLEPEVLSRSHVSAYQIADSNVLAPATEQFLFEKRHEFNLIVFYDQDSENVVQKPQTAEDRAISGLYNALSQYDFFGKTQVKSAPKLLRGGLDAWTSLVGRASLQSSSTTMVKKETSSAMMRSFLNPRRKYVTRPIQDAAEAKRWEDNLADSGAISPIRTTEDFLRRFPPVLEHRESMMAPVSPPTSRPQSPFQNRLSHEESLYTSLPSPPARPPPALPRRSYSGLAEPEDSSLALANKGQVPLTLEAPRKYRTGLQNPGVFCFANSSLQSMFATPGFARDVYSGQWKDVYRVPTKPDEQIENPQLLMKCLANLFHWLNQGTFRALAAKTFMEYIRFIHSKGVDGRRKPDSESFGGPCQQDAQEFYSFIMDNIHDETNTRRNMHPLKEKTYTPRNGTIIQNAIDYWRDYSHSSASIVDKYFRGLEVFISRCHNRACRQEVRLFQPCDLWILNLAGAGDTTDLDSLLVNHQTSEHFPDLVCETCKQPGRTRKAKFARLPDRLAFCLNRFDNTTGRFTRSGKIHTKVRFPIRDLDLTRYCAEPDPDLSTTDDRHFAGRMRYDCYAVTVHVGQGINGGHYYTYVQDETSKDPTDWWKCNDDLVERVKVGGGGHGDVTEGMVKRWKE
ncbi:ubiquitin-specific protease doa4 [Collariella sp. IMI 366227]|nr:ubiquitin-specific protease doa4 [Collariella sp. IMI 366227]